MRLVFFGTPEFAVPCLDALLNSGHEVLAVVTQPDRRSGRGKQIINCPVKLEALKNALRILQPLKVKDENFIRGIKILNPSVIVVVAYGQIFPVEIIDLPQFGCVNVHASLLPQYRGAAPVNWAIINGDEETGITTMLMDRGMDTGPVLIQEKVEIKIDDTAGSLSQRLSDIGADVLIRTLGGMESGGIKPVPQTGDISYAPLLQKTDGLIRWSKSAGEISNFVRGMNPWPCAFSFLDGERIKILKAESLEGNAEPAVVEVVGREKLLVGTGRGMLSILEIQPAGKSVMAVKAFIQGRKIKKGIRFYEKTVD